MPSLLQRLKERKIVQWAAVYLAGAWLFLEALGFVADTFAWQAFVALSAVVLAAVGFFVVLVLAWYHGEKGRQRASGVELLILAGILIVAGAAVATLGRAPQREIVGELLEVSHAAVSEKSVAVLPFVNIGGDRANEYFSDGITEEVITKLARIESLQVASRTSVSRFKHTEADIAEVATQLGVRYILEGSVRRANEKVRITAQLIDSETGFHLWAEDFDGTLEDIFDVQEQTALQIAEALNLQLTPEERQAVQHRYTDKTEAYDAYLQGQALLIFYADRDKLQAAREHFENAITLEPDYAPALAGLASVEAHAYRNIDPSEDRLRRGERLAMRALELDSELVRAHLVLGEIVAMRYDYVGAEEKFRDALAVDPGDPYAWDLLSWTLAYQQPPRAVEAEQAAREAIRLQPDFTAAYYHLGRALLLQNKHQEALEAFHFVLDRIPDSKLGNFGQAQAYLAMGEYVKAEHAAKASMRQSTTPIELVGLSYAYAAQGKIDEALAELERALELDYRDFEALELAPYLSELRLDPRYEALITRYRTR